MGWDKIERRQMVRHMHRMQHTPYHLAMLEVSGTHVEKQSSASSITKSWVCVAGFVRNTEWT